MPTSSATATRRRSEASCSSWSTATPISIGPGDRPRSTELGFRLRELVHAIGVPLLVLLLVLVFLPVVLIGLLVYLVLLRWHERRDPAPHVKPTPELVQELAALEDHLVQNPFTAIGLVKPGMFRRLTMRTILMGIDYSTRHVFNHGNLAGVKTIHFARWVSLDNGRRVMFASNYDGSLESYMDDFIDKIAWGLNIVFSNGFGYPRARFLILDGARDELAFKDYLRLPPGADARLALAVRAALCREHQQQRADPRRAPGGRRARKRRSSGCAACRTGARGHSGARRARVRRSHRRDLPPRPDRGRSRRANLARRRRRAPDRGERAARRDGRSISPSRARGCADSGCRPTRSGSSRTSSSTA